MDNKPAKKNYNLNYASAILVYIWAFAFLYYIPSIKNVESKTFPYIVSILSIVLATLLLLKTFFKWGKEENFDLTGTRSVIVMAILLLAYIVASGIIGFYLATPLYLYITMWSLGQRNKKVMLMISILMPIGVYLFFDLLLSMNIQEGLLIPWVLDLIR